MTLGELNRILDDWCDVKVVPNDGNGDELNLTTKSKVDYFNEHVRKDPEKICLVDPLNREALVGSKPERLTYRQLDQAASAVAAGTPASTIAATSLLVFDSSTRNSSPP